MSVKQITPQMLVKIRRALGGLQRASPAQRDRALLERVLSLVLAIRSLISTLTCSRSSLVARFCATGISTASARAAKRVPGLA